MKKTKKILVPVDFSDTARKAYDFARAIAGKMEAELHLMHVIYPQVENIDEPLAPSRDATEVKSALLEDRMVQFAGAEIRVTDDPEAPKVFHHIEVGAVIPVIRKKARDYDLIIMGTRGEHAAIEQLLGTVTSDVVISAICPVVVVPQFFEKNEINRIAHALDLKWINEKKLSKWANVLQIPQAEVHLVTFRENKESDDDTQTMTKCKDALQTILPDSTIRAHQLDEHDVLEGLRHFVDQHKIDLLIMYRGRNTWKRKLFHRSVTRQMAGQTNIPLLVI